MNKLTYLLAAASIIGILSTGCEVEVKSGDIDASPELTINSLISTDTVLTVTVTSASSFKDFTIDEYIDFADYERQNYNDDIVRQTVVQSARVVATVNDKDAYTLTYDAGNLNFRSDYRPKEGDRIRIEVAADGFPTASASAMVPTHQKLEIVDCQRYYDPMSFETDTNTAQDTLARITLRLTDPAAETNFYRLKVRSAGHLGDLYLFKDSFASSDIIFKNVGLHKGYGGWAAGMSNVFSDYLINGKTYEFTVETRLRETRPVLENGRSGPENKWVIVELQSLSPDFYRYLNSIWTYRITDRDAYSEAVAIHSNVDGGWGIVGAVASEKHIVSF